VSNDTNDWFLVTGFHGCRATLLVLYAMLRISLLGSHNWVNANKISFYS